MTDAAQTQPLMDLPAGLATTLEWCGRRIAQGLQEVAGADAGPGYLVLRSDEGKHLGWVPATDVTSI